MRVSRRVYSCLARTFGSFASRCQPRSANEGRGWTSSAGQSNRRRNWGNLGETNHINRPVGHLAPPFPPFGLHSYKTSTLLSRFLQLLQLVPAPGTSPVAPIRHGCRCRCDCWPRRGLHAPRRSQQEVVQQQEVRRPTAVTPNTR